jgi:hypothetical protein
VILQENVADLRTHFAAPCLQYKNGISNGAHLVVAVYAYMLNWDCFEAKSETLRCQFDSAKPFRHVVIDDILVPSVARSVEQGFETALQHKQHGARKSHRDVLLKTGTPNFSVMTPDQVSVFDAIHSDRFVNFLENITGIAPVFADPELRGGGLHSSWRGGYLNVHTDFNFHPAEDTHRRLNLIIYVNEKWSEEWGGALELWNSEVSRCEARFLPKFNRAVLFETSEISFHGHPVPLTCPEGVTRKSLAVYYYSHWPEGLIRRAKTNYVLTPVQKDDLRHEVLRAISLGAKTFEEASEMIPRWQPAHVKRIFAELARVGA